jgi:2-ketoarginine methyltransferase
MLKDDLGGVLDYAAKWATAELVRGLLQHEPLYEALRDGVTATDAALLTGLPERAVSGLLAALEVEGFVRRDGDRFTLGPLGEPLDRTRGWLELLMNGYAGYFHHAAELWSGTVRTEWRHMPSVGLASARMAELDVVPMLTALFARLNPEARLVLDFGCGRALTLIRLCQALPRLRGVGVEPEAALAAQALDAVTAADLSGSVAIVNRPAQLYDHEHEPPDFVLFAFVLQELVEQIGEPGVVSTLVDLAGRFPDARFVAVEIDPTVRADPARMRENGLLRGFYNYYFALHDLTEQRLLSWDEWERLFAEAGLRLETTAAAPDDVDDSGALAALCFRV